MTLHVKHQGVWKAVTPYVKKGGVWKPILEHWVKKGGVWQKVFAAVTATFSPPPGSYASNNGGIGGGPVTSTITCTSGGPVVWSWTATGSTGALTANVANGGSANSITFTLTPAATSTTRSAHITVSANGQNWVIDLTAYGNGGGGVGGATMTL